MSYEPPPGQPPFAPGPGQPYYQQQPYPGQPPYAQQYPYAHQDPYAQQQPYPQPPYTEPWLRQQGGQNGHRAAMPRRKRRIFLWVFLGIQALFLIWVITGAASGSDIHSQAVAYCHAHPDQFLPFAQCVSDYGTGSKAGAAIGIGLIIVLWAVVDIILGISYAVYRLAKRPA